MHREFPEGKPKRSSHLSRLLMYVANQGLEFSQAIWFML